MLVFLHGLTLSAKLIYWRLAYGRTHCMHSLLKERTVKPRIKTLPCSLTKACTLNAKPYECNNDRTYVNNHALTHIY
jgi:hypothetical protein